METLVYVLILFVIFANGQINKSCTNDKDCDATSKFFCIQNFCRCKIGYRKMENFAQCVLVPGTTCNNNEDCENFPGAICDENKKCICQGGYTAGKTECDNIGQRGDSCTNHAICVARMQDDNIECKNNLCMCKEGFHERNDFKCTRISGLEDQCSDNNDCYLIVNDQNVLECSADKICKCRSGFKQNGDSCISGSPELLTISIPIMTFLILAIFKF